MENFKITKITELETFLNINNVRVMIDKAQGTSDKLDYYMVYCKGHNGHRGVYTLCGDITRAENAIISQYISDKDFLNNSRVFKCIAKTSDEIDSACYKALENIVTIFKLEYGLK